MNAIDRILVPVDFSSCSQVACDLAATFASRFGAAIELLHVWDIPAFSGAVLSELVVNMGAAAEEDPSLPGVIQSRATRAMQHLVENLERRGVHSVRGRVEMMGEPADAIVRYAEEGGFSLIVMGTHGRTGFSRLLMGSVAEKVVRAAPCPVLTVRVPEEGAPETEAAVTPEGATR